LVNSQTVKISFSIPEKYAGKIKSGTQIQFTVDGNSKPFSAKIYAMDPGIETDTRTLQIKAKTNNTGNQLVPGSFAKITLPLAGIADAILIPTQAVIPVLKGKKVFISSNGLAKEVLIETGPRTEKNILVLSGLAVGDTLLTSGMMSIKNEAPVKITVKN
jgi:membrane fusion protein (multidrug efflux system)